MKKGRKKSLDDMYDVLIFKRGFSNYMKVSISQQLFEKVGFSTQYFIGEKIVEGIKQLNEALHAAQSKGIK